MEFVKHQEADGMCVDVFVCVCLCVHVWVCFGLKRGLTDGEGAWVDIYLVGRGGGFILGLLQPPFPLSPGERWVHTAVIYSRERRELLRPSNMYYFHTHCT